MPLATPTRARTRAGLLALPLLAPLAAADVPGTNGVTELISADAGGQPATEDSKRPSISEDGRYVAFVSRFPLLPGDLNMERDVYVLDRQTGTYTCASTTAGGTFGNAWSGDPDISADGRWVVFWSDATNLQALDFNGAGDVFRKDLQTGALIRASDAWLSPVAGNSHSSEASVSDDGRFVCFTSQSSDLVPADTNVTVDVFVRDMQTGLTQRVSEGVFGQANAGSYGARISGDGAHVAFHSDASNLTPFDLNGERDVFLAQLGSFPALISRNLGGFPANGPSSAPVISTDGGTVAFQSDATDLVKNDLNGASDVFVYRVGGLPIELASLTSQQTQVAGPSTLPRISRDGRVVAFDSPLDLASHASPFEDVFVRDLDTDRTWTASRPTGTVAQSDGDSADAALALGGSVVAFRSYCPFGLGQIYLRTMHPDPFAYCTGSTTAAGCQPSLTPSGFSSVSSEDFFTILGDDLPNRRNGLLFYGFDGPAAKPFAGATMCIQGSKKRTPLMNTGGSLPGVDDCTGFFAFDMNAFAAGTLGGNPKPELSFVGQQVNVQFWGRDPAGPSGSFLSAALEYVVGP